MSNLSVLAFDEAPRGHGGRGRGASGGALALAQGHPDALDRADARDAPDGLG